MAYHVIPNYSSRCRCRHNRSNSSSSNNNQSNIISSSGFTCFLRHVHFRLALASASRIVTIMVATVVTLSLRTALCQAVTAIATVAVATETPSITITSTSVRRMPWWELARRCPLSVKLELFRDIRPRWPPLAAVVPTVDHWPQFANRGGKSAKVNRWKSTAEIAYNQTATLAARRQIMWTLSLYTVMVMVTDVCKNLEKPELNT